MVVHKYATKTSPTQSKHLLRKLRVPFARVVCVPPFRGGNTKFFPPPKKCPMPKIATGMTTCSVNMTAPTQVRMHGTAECSGLPFLWSGAIATSRDHSRTLGQSNPAGGISPSRASRSPRHKRADGQPRPLPQKNHCILRRSPSILTADVIARESAGQWWGAVKKSTIGLVTAMSPFGLARKRTEASST